MLAREGCCLNDDFVVLENPLSNELCRSEERRVGKECVP